MPNYSKTVSPPWSPNTMMNIFSLGGMMQKYRVTMDTDVENSIFVHGVNGNTLKFRNFDTKLYLLDKSEVVYTNDLIGYVKLRLILGRD